MTPAGRTALAAAFVGLGCVLGGCAPSETELLTGDFVARDPFPLGPPVYCYRTLAEPDCYRTPQAAEASRLIGAHPSLY